MDFFASLLDCKGAISNLVISHLSEMKLHNPCLLPQSSTAPESLLTVDQLITASFSQPADYTNRLSSEEMREGREHRKTERERKIER
jgi:hypothetical protein